MKKSLPDILAGVTYLPRRTPEMAFTGGAEAAFAEVAALGNAAIYVGHYSGKSEWERHTAGDELVMALGGSTTLVMLKDGVEERFPLVTMELVVVPAGVWHRFDASLQLQVLTITPDSTEHRLERPDA